MHRSSSPVCRDVDAREEHDRRLHDVARGEGRAPRGAGECQAVKDRFADWVYESADVFGVPLPDTIDGTCPAGTKPVFRLFNNRSDANHRYTTSIDIRDQMRSLGWIAEGYGPEAVAMCAQ